MTVPTARQRDEDVLVTDNTGERIRSSIARRKPSFLELHSSEPVQFRFEEYSPPDPGPTTAGFRITIWGSQPARADLGLVEY